MEITRELFWNIGQNASVLIPFYLLATTAICFAIVALLRRVRVYLQGKALQPFHHSFTQISQSLLLVLLQKRVRSNGWKGNVHTVLFWSIVMLFIGTLLIAVQEYFLLPLFDITLLSGIFYQGYSLLLDLAGLGTLLALLPLAISSLLAKRLSSPAVFVTYLLLAAIVFSGFLLEGIRIAATELNTANALWSPVGLAVATILSSTFPSIPSHFYKGVWWAHAFLSFGLIACTPLLHLRHMVTISGNYLLSPHTPKGTLPLLQLEDESAESFGIATRTDLNVKDILETDSCVECGHCQKACPAWNSDSDLSPMQVIQQLHSAAFSKENIELIQHVGKNAIWDCTTCLACEETCPSSIQHINKIVGMRQNLALMHGEFSDSAATTAMEQIEHVGNPFGKPLESRTQWVSDEKALSSQVNTAEILYFTGCYASFDSTNQQVAQHFVALCKTANVSLHILGNDERCCGDPARKLGNEYLFQTIASQNITAIHKTGIATIVTTCPHCYNTLNKDYRQLGLIPEVLSHTEFFSNLLSDDRLTIKDTNFSCTYHDPCHLSRHNDCALHARSVLTATGAKIREMELHGKQTFCCGGGGGKMFTLSPTSSKMASKRLTMATDTGEALLVTSCPFCLTMFENAKKSLSVKESIQIADITEILLAHVSKKKVAPTACPSSALCNGNGA